MYRTTYHRVHTVTIWDVYAQGWVRTAAIRRDILSSLSAPERTRVVRHCAAHID